MKIAIIVTKFFEEFIINAMKELAVDFEYKIYTYHRYREIPKVFDSIPDDVDGVITSGIYLAEIIRKTHPDTKKIIGYFNSDDAGICRLFLQLFMENPKLDLERIYGDFTDAIGVSLEEYFKNDPKLSYSELIAPYVRQMPLEEMFEIEEKQIKKHVDLYKAGKTELSVTRYSSIVEDLEKEGVKTYVPLPSLEYLREVFDGFLKEIEIMHMESNCPAVVNITIVSQNEGGKKGLPFQQRLLQLQGALVDFCGTSALDYVLQPVHSGFELLTNRKTVEEYTEGYTVCRLGAYLKERLDCHTSVGYGIGHDIYQARVHAISAAQEAAASRRGNSYLMNEKEELIGPLGTKSSVTAATNAGKEYGEIAHKAGLSPLTVNKVLSVIWDMPMQQITAYELSLKLGITKRSANRYLTALSQAGALVPREFKRPTTKGRPQVVFGIGHIEN